MSFWTSLRDTVQSVGAAVGNVVLPGSGLVTSNLVSKGAQEQLGSTLGQAAMIGGGLYGVGAGNLANYGTAANYLGLGGGGLAQTATEAAIDAGTLGGAAQPAAGYGGLFGAGGTFPGVGQAVGSFFTPSSTAAGAGAGTTASKAGDLASYLGAGSNVLGGFMQANAINRASAAQQAAADKAVALQEAMYNQQRADIAPWRTAGEMGLAQYAAGIAPGGELARPFTMKDYQADPGYAFRVSEGMKALDRTAAARGGLLSGATLKGAQRFGQESASQEYQNAYNRYVQNQQTQRNALANLAGIGQTASQQLQRAGEAYTPAASELQQGIGNVRASGYMQGANALAGGLTGGINAYQNQQLLNSLMNRGQ
jgi:hypothetical protein